MDAFTEMLREAADNVRLRKQLIQQGHSAKDVARAIRTRVTATKTDNIFKVGPLSDQIKDPFVLKHMVAEYRRHTGKSPNQNMVYVPCLVPSGARPGHPDAWVDRKNARSDVLRVAEKRDMILEGHIERDAKHESPPTPKKKIAKNIVRRMVSKTKRENPDLAAKKSDRELAEIVVDKHSLRR